MKRFFLLTVLLLAPSAAFGQCTGLFPASTICGNFGVSQAPPGPAAIAGSGLVLGPGASTVGHFATWNNTTGSLLADYNLFGTTNTWTGTNNFNGTTNFGAAANITATGGSTVRSLQDIAANVVFAKDYGAVCNSSTDDTSALQAAISATPSGGTLMLPNGFCKVLGSGTAALTISQSIYVEGQGWGSGITADAAFPNTRDFIVVTTNAAARGFGFRNFRIVTSSLGRHGIRIDGQTNGFMYGFQFDNLLIDTTNAGVSIYGTGASAAGGILAYSTIANSLIDSILLDSVGDGLNIVANNIGGTGSIPSIKATAVPGAGGLYIRGNVLTGVGGQIVIERGYPVIDSNELEQFVNSTNANGAMIDLNGGTGIGVSSAQIINNTFSVIAGITGVTNAIRLAVAADTTIAGNRIGIRSTNDHIATTSSATDTVIEASNAYYTDDVKVGLKMTDAGLRTGITAADHILTLSANQTGTDVNTAQTWFPGGGATQITVLANSTYEFEGLLAFARTAGANNHTTSNLFGGTATVSSIAYMFEGTQTTSGFFAYSGNYIAQYQQAATAAALFGAIASATENLTHRVKGIVRFTTAGTFIPQFIFSAAPGGAPTVQANSYFKMRLIGSNTFLSKGWN